MYALPEGWQYDENGDPIEPPGEGQVGLGSVAAASQIVKDLGLDKLAWPLPPGAGSPQEADLFGAGFWKAVSDGTGEPELKVTDQNVVTKGTLGDIVTQFLSGIDGKGRSAEFQDAFIELQKQLRKGVAGLTGSTRLVNDPQKYMADLRKVLNDMVAPVPEPRDIEAIYDKLSEQIFMQEPEPSRLTISDIDQAEGLTAIGYELGRMLRGGRVDGRAIESVFKKAQEFKLKREEAGRQNRALQRAEAAQQLDIQSKLFNIETNDQSNREAMLNRLTEQATQSELGQEQAISQTAMQMLAPRFLDPNYAVGFIQNAAKEMDGYLSDLKKGLQKVGIPAQQVLILGDLAQQQIEMAATVAPPEFAGIMRAIAKTYSDQVDTILQGIPQAGFTTDVLRAAQTAKTRADAALTGKEVGVFEQKFWREGLKLWDDIRKTTYAHADNMAALSLARERFNWDAYAKGQEIDIAKAALALNGMKFVSEQQAVTAGRTLQVMSQWSDTYAKMAQRSADLKKSLQEYEQSSQAQTLDPKGEQRKKMQAEIAMIDKALASFPLLPGMTGQGDAADKAAKAKWDKIAQALQNPGSLTPEQRQQLFYGDPNQALMDIMGGAGRDSVFFGATYQKYAEQLGGMGSMLGGYGMPSYGQQTPGEVQLTPDVINQFLGGGSYAPVNPLPPGDKYSPDYRPG